MAIYERGREPSPDPQSASTLIPGLVCLQNCENYILLFTGSPSVVFCNSGPNGLRQPLAGRMNLGKFLLLFQLSRAAVNLNKIIPTKLLARGVLSTVFNKC